MIFGGKSNTICSFGEKIAFRRSQCDLKWPQEDFVPPMFDCGPAGCSHCCPNNNDCCEQTETSVLFSNQSNFGTGRITADWRGGRPIVAQRKPPEFFEVHWKRRFHFFGSSLKVIIEERSHQSQVWKKEPKKPLKLCR